MKIKKILGIAALAVFFSVILWVFSYAFEDTWVSSNTATIDVSKNLCPGITFLVNGSTTTTGNHGIFHGVCVGLPSGVVASSMTVYNSSATATNSIASVETSTASVCSFYDVAVSSGLTYSNWQAANISILYTCY